jgi:hypothetical protein
VLSTVVAVMAGALAVTTAASAAPSLPAGGVTLGPLDDLHEKRVTVRGVIREEDGRPVAGARIWLSTTIPRNDGFLGYGPAEHYATTDAAGWYELPDVQPPIRTAIFGVHSARITVTVDDPDVAIDGDPELGTQLRDAAAAGRTTLQHDAAVRRVESWIRGRVAVAGRDDPGPVRVTVYGPSHGVAAVDEHGNYEIPVRSGRYTVLAQSLFGLPEVWPRLPAAPRIWEQANLDVGHRQDRTGVDFELRPRRPYAAMDETGRWQDGYASATPRPELTDLAEACYEPGARPIGVRRAAPLLVQASNQRGTFPGLQPNEYFVQFPIQFLVRNLGDAPIRMRDVRFEGPDAASFSVPDDGWCRRVMIGSADNGFIDVRIARPTSRREFRATLVVPGSGGADLRIPVIALNGESRNADGSLTFADRLAAGAAGAFAPGVGRKPRPGTAPTLTGLQLTSRRVEVHFPAAGRATVRFARRAATRRGGGRRSWRTVRTVRLRSSGAGERRAPMPRLRSGRYRVSLAAQIGGQPARRLTIYHHVRGH